MTAESYEDKLRLQDAFVGALWVGLAAPTGLFVPVPSYQAYAPNDLVGQSFFEAGQWLTASMALEHGLLVDGRPDPTG